MTLSICNISGELFRIKIITQEEYLKYTLENVLIQIRKQNIDYTFIDLNLILINKQLWIRKGIN